MVLLINLDVVLTILSWLKLRDSSVLEILIQNRHQAIGIINISQLK